MARWIAPSKLLPEDSGRLVDVKFYYGDDLTSQYRFVPLHYTEDRPFQVLIGWHKKPVTLREDDRVRFLDDKEDSQLGRKTKGRKIVRANFRRAPKLPKRKAAGRSS
jgi:hypothetical protein